MVETLPVVSAGNLEVPSEFSIGFRSIYVPDCTDSFLFDIRAISYSANFSPNGNAYLGVYGWTTNPLVEYYILENYGDYNPGSQMTQVGTVTSDGSSYTIYNHTQTNQPSIEGTSTFQQYWSIRSSHRSSGTVTTSNHFNAWKSLGLNLGSFDYQILLTEAYESQGTSSVTLGSTSSSPPPPPPPPPPSGQTTTKTTTTTSKPASGGSGVSFALLHIFPRAYRRFS